MAAAKIIVEQSSKSVGVYTYIITGLVSSMHSELLAQVRAIPGVEHADLEPNRGGDMELWAWTGAAVGDEILRRIQRLLPEASVARRRYRGRR